MTNTESRAESTLRQEDVKLSDKVYEFLDKNFYSTEVSNFERATDKLRQISGIDVIFDIGDKHYIADEKAAVRYRNLKTYTLELSFINRANEVQDGWLINENQLNNSYVFVWLDKDEYIGKESITVAVIEKQRILDYLNKKGWTRENLVKKMNYIREGKQTYMGDVYKDGCKFIFSTQLVEKPINIQLPRNVYMMLADKIWTHDFE